MKPHFDSFKIVDGRDITIDQYSVHRVVRSFGFDPDRGTCLSADNESGCCIFPGVGESIGEWLLMFPAGEQTVYLQPLPDLEALEDALRRLPARRRYLADDAADIRRDLKMTGSLDVMMIPRPQNRAERRARRRRGRGS